MAVPPADDGALAANDPADSPPRRTFTILTIGFAVVALVCLTLLGVKFVTADGSAGDRVQQVLGKNDNAAAGDAADDPADREAVMSQANQFMLRVNTYGPDDLDKDLKLPGYVESVHEVITPKFAVDFDQNVTLAEQSVAKAGYARSAELFSTGVDTMDSDTASVLVSGVLNSSYPDSAKDGRQEFPPEPFRVRVTLLRVEGTWLVDDFAPVTDEVEQGPSGGQPTIPPSTPSSTPTGKATGKPSGPATQKPGQKPTSTSTTRPRP